MSRMSLIAALFTAGLALWGCPTTNAYITVPCIPADQLERSGLAAKEGVSDLDAEGRTVVLICPAKGRVEIPVKGGEKLFQVLSSGGALEDYMNGKLTKMAIIRPVQPASGAGSGAERSVGLGVVVVMIDATALLESGMWENNVTIAAGDTIIIPDKGESVEQRLLEEFGFQLRYVSHAEPGRVGEPSGAAAGAAAS